MNPIIKNAQREYEIFKRTELRLSNETIFYHAYQISIYEYLLFMLESTDWEDFKKKHAIQYESLVSYNSLLNRMCDSIISEEFQLFNSYIFDDLLKSI